MHQHGGSSFKSRVVMGVRTNNFIDFMDLTLFFILIIKRKKKHKVTFRDSINMIKWIKEENCITISKEV